jgi:hypothetical protein
MSTAITDTNTQQPLPEEVETDPMRNALKNLREEYRRRNGNMVGYFEEIFKNRPKPPSPCESWFPPREFIEQQLRRRRH